MQLLEKILGNIWERHSKIVNLLDFKDGGETAFIFSPHTPLVFTNKSLHISTVPTDLMNKSAEAPQLPQLLFGIGCVQHTGDKFRLRLRGTSGPRAAPLEIWEHLHRELHRLCFRQQKEPGVSVAVLVHPVLQTLLWLQWQDALWRSSLLPHSPTDTCSVRNCHFCHCRNPISVWENDPPRRRRLFNLQDNL